MSEQPLAWLIAEATALAGGNTCASGHDWTSDAARACPHGSWECSQAAYFCKRCGTFDYGEPGGPGHADCQDGCSHDAQNILAGNRQPVEA